MGGYLLAQYPLAQARQAPMLHQSQLSSTVYSGQQRAPPRITIITLPGFGGRASMNRRLNHRAQDRPRPQPIYWWGGPVTKKKPKGLRTRS